MPVTLHGLVGEGVTNGYVIRYDRENFLSATNRSAIVDRGEYLEGLRINSTPGEAGAGSQSVHW